MEVSALQFFVVGEVFAFLFIFARLGAAFSILPGFSENYVPARVRLTLALMFSLALTPMLQPFVPEIPGSPLTLGALMVGEVLVGVFYGTIVRFMTSAAHIAGSIISYQSSLAIASLFDANQGGQTTIVSNFVGIMALVFIFALDLHHVMLTGIVESYSLFQPGLFPVVGDMANTLAQLLAGVFRVSVQLAAPHIVFSMLFYLGCGVLARLMPNMQVFFVIMPLHIVLSFFLLIIILPTMLFTMHDVMSEMLNNFLNP